MKKFLLEYVSCSADGGVEIGLKEGRHIVKISCSIDDNFGVLTVNTSPDVFFNGEVDHRKIVSAILAFNEAVEAQKKWIDK